MSDPCIAELNVARKFRSLIDDFRTEFDLLGSYVFGSWGE
jgi:hypothetical protein